MLSEKKKRSLYNECVQEFWNEMSSLSVDILGDYNFKDPAKREEILSLIPEPESYAKLNEYKTEIKKYFRDEIEEGIQKGMDQKKVELEEELNSISKVENELEQYIETMLKMTPRTKTYPKSFNRDWGWCSRSCGVYITNDRDYEIEHGDIIVYTDDHKYYSFYEKLFDIFRPLLNYISKVDLAISLVQPAKNYINEYGEPDHLLEKVFHETIEIAKDFLNQVKEDNSEDYSDMDELKEYSEIDED